MRALSSAIISVWTRLVVWMPGMRVVPARRGGPFAEVLQQHVVDEDAVVAAGPDIDRLSRPRAALDQLRDPTSSGRGRKQRARSSPSCGAQRRRAERRRRCFVAQRRERDCAGKFVSTVGDRRRRAQVRRTRRSGDPTNRGRMHASSAPPSAIAVTTDCIRWMSCVRTMPLRKNSQRDQREQQQAAARPSNGPSSGAT